MNKNEPQKTISFELLKNDILKEINSPEGAFKLDESTTLFPEFINQPFYTEITGATIIGGPTVPMIMLIGNNTGRIYLFALKAVLKNNPAFKVEGA